MENFKDCRSIFKKKLFLTSNDLMTQNVSSRILFQVYVLFDFIFLIYYPLERIYHSSDSAIYTQTFKQDAQANTSTASTTAATSLEESVSNIS